MKNRLTGKTFWDFCAPFYDLAQKVNSDTYEHMLKTVDRLIPQNATILEAGAGTGSIGLAVANKASHVLCTDVSEKMLRIARRKVIKRGIKNVSIESRDIFALGESDDAFDVVIAGQVLHLIDKPDKAATELKRIAKSMVIMPMSFTKNLCGMTKFGVSIYRLYGFTPKIEFTAEEYERWLPTVGFDQCDVIQILGKLPMAVAVWRKS